MQETSQAIKDIKSTLNKLITSMNVHEKGKLHSQPLPNPQVQFISDSNSSNSHIEQAKSVTTLRSGKVIDKTIPTDDHDPKEKSSDIPDVASSNEELRCLISSPFL